MLRFNNYSFLRLNYVVQRYVEIVLISKIKLFQIRPETGKEYEHFVNFGRNKKDKYSNVWSALNIWKI